MYQGAMVFDLYTQDLILITYMYIQWEVILQINCLLILDPTVAIAVATSLSVLAVIAVVIAVVIVMYRKGKLKRKGEIMFTIVRYIGCHCPKVIYWLNDTGWLLCYCVCCQFICFNTETLFGWNTLYPKMGIELFNPGSLFCSARLTFFYNGKGYGLLLFTQSTAIMYMYII